MTPNSPEFHRNNPSPTRAALKECLQMGGGDDEPNGYVAPTRTPDRLEHPKDGDGRDLQLPITTDTPEQTGYRPGSISEHLPGWGRKPQGQPN